MFYFSCKTLFAVFHLNNISSLAEDDVFGLRIPRTHLLDMLATTNSRKKMGCHVPSFFSRLKPAAESRCGLMPHEIILRPFKYKVISVRRNAGMGKKSRIEPEKIRKIP
jgi:hypothetical protein